MITDDSLNPGPTKTIIDTIERSLSERNVRYSPLQNRNAADPCVRKRYPDKTVESQDATDELKMRIEGTDRNCE